MRGGFLSVGKGGKAALSDEGKGRKGGGYGTASGRRVGNEKKKTAGLVRGIKGRPLPRSARPEGRKVKPANSPT